MNLTLEVTTGPNWPRSVQIVRTAEMIWYDVLVQFSFPSLVTDPGKQGIIGKLIHSSSYAVSKHPDICFVCGVSTVVGFSETSFELLEVKSKSMKGSERCCVILFYEFERSTRDPDTVDGLLGVATEEDGAMQRSPGVHGARLDGEMETDSRLLLCPECLRSSRSAPTVNNPGGETSGNQAETNGCGVRPGVNQQVTLNEEQNMQLRHVTQCSISQRLERRTPCQTKM